MNVTDLDDALDAKRRRYSARLSLVYAIKGMVEKLNDLNNEVMAGHGLPNQACERLEMIAVEALNAKATIETIQLKQEAAK